MINRAGLNRPCCLFGVLCIDFLNDLNISGYDFLLVYSIIMSEWNVIIVTGSARKQADNIRAFKSITVRTAKSISKKSIVILPASQV